MSATIPSGLTLTGTGIPTSRAGGQSYDSGTDSFTINGTGAGIWNLQNNDTYFAYTTATGDVEIVAQLVSFTYSANQSEAGLLISSSLSATEVNRAATWYWPACPVPGGGLTNELAFIGWGPPVAGNASYFEKHNDLPKNVAPPYWLKLVRVGNNFGSYWSLDGRDWNLIGTTSGGALFGTGSMYVGLFVNSHGGGTAASANFDNVYIGPPRLKYKTSWIGDTSGGLADGHASCRISALWVKGDGTCYANGPWDEQSQSAKAYQEDGKVAFWIADETNHIGNSGLYQGTVTGNSNNLFLATSSSGNRVYRTDFNGNKNSVTELTLPGLGAVGGLAASDSRLFISDTTNNTVRIVNLSTSPPTEMTAAVTAGIIDHPGPIAFDGTNFWITDCGSPFPLTNYVTTQSGYTPRIRCYSDTGIYQNREITGVTNPTALAVHPSATPTRLYVCDNGSDQNIKYYTGLSSTPTYGGAFGVAATSTTKGGIWYSTSPGLIYEAGMGDWRRFYAPTGVGFDSSGNIYVACGGAGTDLRKFDASGNLIWKQLGLEGVSCGDFDPNNDGQEIYTTEERFTMNYANTAPGSEWSYTAYTKNPFSSYATNDVRNISGVGGANGAQIRRVGGNVFMYTNVQRDSTPCAFFRFNNQGTFFQGTQAIPYGSIVFNNAPGFKLWIDKNADGLETSNEDTIIPQAFGGYQSYDVDSQGTIWLVQGQGNNAGAAPSMIGQLPCASPTPIPAPPAAQVAMIPNYNAAGFKSILCPAPIQSLKSIKYDQVNHVMYCVGRLAVPQGQLPNTGKWVLARYDNWEAINNSNAPDDHPARWVTVLPDHTSDITVLAPPVTSYDTGYTGLGFAGDKLFIADLWGPIRVYDANRGNPILTLNPGPELSATTAWEDMTMGVNVFKRSNGEYLILEENDGWYGSIPLYRWTPAADTNAPGTITNLTATAQGHAIALAWTGPTGMMTSYNIYRGTASGSLTLYQSNVTTPSFVDTNVNVGTTYYYTVVAVNGVGAGSQSNQVSAAPASAQADFVKYDTTTQGTWYTGSTPVNYVYGSEGYCMPSSSSDLTSFSGGYVSSVTHANTVSQLNVAGDSPVTDSRYLLKPSGGIRTSAYYMQQSATSPHSHVITFSDNNWHQVSIYMLYIGKDAQNNDIHTQFDKVEVLDGDETSTTVLDSRQPMDYSGGKWLVWNIRGTPGGKVTIRVSQGFYFPRVSGIFFDPVKTSTPTVAWWKLDGDASDSSGSGNNAAKNGGTWTTPCKINGGLTFGGTNATSNLFLWFVPPTPTITYSMWFKTSTSGVLLGLQNSATGTTPTTYAPILYVGTDNKLHGAFYTGTIQTIKSTATVTNGAWHHAALTSNGTTQTLYLDGEAVGTLWAPVSQMSSFLNYIYCGQGYVSGWPDITGTQVYFNGQVDDLRLYNRVLPASEIWQLSHP